MNKLFPYLIGLILVTLSAWLQVSSIGTINHFINNLKDVVYDWQLRTTLLLHPRKLVTSVAIVDIDDISLEKEGRWPWPRSKLAELIANIQEQGAAVIAVDVLFPEEESNTITTILNEISKLQLKVPEAKLTLEPLKPYFDNDAKLASILTKSDSLIGFSFSDENKIIGEIKPPLMILKTPTELELKFYTAQGYIGANAILAKSVKNMGFVNYYPDADGIVRRVPLLMRYQDALYPSLALEAVHTYLLNTIKLKTASYGGFSNIEGVQVGDNVLPTDEKAQVIVPFRGKSHTFPYYSATDVLHKTLSAKILEDKIIFIGSTATGLGDMKAVAVDDVFPGVEIQATIADGVLKHDFWYKPAWAPGAELFLTVILGLLMALIYPLLGPRVLVILIILIPPLLLYAHDEFLLRTKVILSIFFPFLLSIFLAVLNIAYGYLFEARKKEHLKAIFGQYVPAAHIDKMLQTRGSFGLLGEDREMTILFTDIRNFTTMSETMSATQIKDMLSQLFTPMTEIIFKTKGTIDKYIGDAIMAFWGAPLHDPEHTAHALSAALDMQTVLEKLRKSFEKQKLPIIEMGIGLNRGIMTVGDMGSKFRRNYTVLGSEVNLGSRVEGLTKYYGVKILVTENTQHNQKEFVFRLIDKVQVKGANEPIAIYECVDYVKTIPVDVLEDVKLSNMAMDCYFQQKWNEAMEIFQKLHAKNPQNKFYKIYMERIKNFQHEAPSVDWNGVYVHTYK